MLTVGLKPMRTGETPSVLGATGPAATSPPNSNAATGLTAQYATFTVIVSV